MLDQQIALLFFCTVLRALFSWNWTEMFVVNSDVPTWIAKPFFFLKLSRNEASLKSY